MDEPSLQDYIAVFRRRRRVVVSCMVLVVALALGLSLTQTPQYRAESELLLKGTTSESLLVDGAGLVRSSRDSARELNNEIRRIESRKTRDAVDQAYDGPLDVDDVQAIAPASDENDIIKIRVTSSSAAAAKELVDQFAETYVETRRETQVEDLLAAGEEIQTRLDDIQAQIRQVRAPLDAIEAGIAAATAGSPERAQLEAERDSMAVQLAPQLSPLQNRESSFHSQLEQLQATQDLSTSGGVTILAPASEPTSPVSPRTVRNVMVGGLVGLLGGFVLAYYVDRLDDSVGSKEECEQLTSLPTLGMIPKTAGLAKSGELVSIDDQTSVAAESYRLLRTSLKFLSIDKHLKTILVTSTAASEGKTVTAANIAVILAQSGERVLIVGADLRRPRVHGLLGARQTPGLTSVLLDDVSVASTIYAIEEVPGLYIMPPGPTPPNPAELLESQRARDILSALEAAYDRVVIDSPPVLPVTDSQILARVADAVLVVVAYRETSRRGLKRAMELLGQVAAPVVGTVLNLVPAREEYGGLPYRYTTYRSRSERRRRRESTDMTDAPAPQHIAGDQPSIAPTAQPSDEETAPQV